MDEHARGAVAQIEAAREVAEEHDRELETLGLVHREDPDARARRGGADLASLFRERTQPQHKAVQPAVAGRFKGLGQRDELHQVAAAPLAVVHGGGHGQQIKVADDLPDQLGAAYVRRRVTQRGKLFQYRAGLFVRRGAGAQRAVQVAVAVGGAESGQLVRRIAKARRAQRREQRDILVGVVEDRKHARDRGDLRRGEKLLSLRGRHRDAAAQQRLAEGRARAAGRAQQDRHVAPACRAPHAIRRDHGSVADQLFYAVRGKLGLALNARGGFLVVRGGACG